MYDWPEARAETDAVWARLRDALRAAGLAAPDRLARRNADLPPVPGGIRDGQGNVIAPDPATLRPEGLDLHTLWRHPSLLFAQACWGPLELGLNTHVRVIGQPDYSAYEGGAGGLGVETIRALHQIGSRGFLPDRTLLLQIPADVAADRAAQRDGNAGDRIGTRGTAYHAEVASAFCAIAEEEPGRFRIVDASGSADEVTGRLIAELTDLLP